MASEIGQSVIALSAAQATQYAKGLGENVEARRCLKVPSGEHLAAIVVSAFLHCMPTLYDCDGGVDMMFDLKSSDWFPDAGEIAFEVKSLHGAFRKTNSYVQRQRKRGQAFDPNFSVRVKNGADVLAEARPTLADATGRLNKKCKASTSKNVFLVVHPFDHFAHDVVLAPAVAGHLLPPVEGFDELTTVWVLWAPDHVTMWNNRTKEWIDMLFADEPNDQTEVGSLSVLQAIEMEYLVAANVEDSPYVFGISAVEADSAVDG